jgi:predicted nuclease of restriction endonuclease-like (RecB) superfamily
MLCTVTDIRVLYKDKKFVTRQKTINIQDEMFPVELIAKKHKLPETRALLHK